MSNTETQKKIDTSFCQRPALRPPATRPEVPAPSPQLPTPGLWRSEPGASTRRVRAALGLSGRILVFSLASRKNQLSHATHHVCALLNEISEHGEHTKPDLQS